jgi:hypothetical protein
MRALIKDPQTQKVKVWNGLFTNFVREFLLRNETGKTFETG